MTAPDPASAIAVTRELDRVMRADRGRLVSVLAGGLRDLSLAEEALHEAAVSALGHWGRAGLPASPQGWLLQVARRKAIDRLRGSARDSRKGEALAVLAADEAAPEPEPEAIPDERLRLIFACCHPALEPKSRVALTLRTVCGLTTPEIASAFLDSEPTMGQRISRAKAKIAAAGIPFAVPEAEHWPARLEAVLTTIYLIFTTGYVAGPDEPRDLCLEAEYLMRMIDRLRPGDAEIEGALAMMLLTAARKPARIGPDGASLPPGEQDRRQWDATRLAEGRAILARAVARRRPGPFQIKAAIADCQMADPAPDWPQIAALYGALYRHEPTAVVQLNAAVAIAEAGEPARGLAMVSALAEPLADYQPFHAARAALLAMTGDHPGATEAYARAIASAPTPADALFLTLRLAMLDSARGNRAHAGPSAVRALTATPHPRWTPAAKACSLHLLNSRPAMIRTSSLSTPVLGALCAVGASAAFTLNDMAIKALSGDYALHQLVLIRTVLGLIVILAVVMPLTGGWHQIRSGRPWLHLLRGVFVVGANLTFFTALATMPLAEATAIFFVSPLILAGLSVVVLGETVGPWRWLAVLVGLVGVVIIIRPGGAAFQLLSLLPLVSAALYAANHVLTRRLGLRDSAATLAFYIQLAFLAVGLAVGLSIGDGKLDSGMHGPALSFLTRAWVWPAPADWPLLLATGLGSAMGGLLISQAYRLCEAALVAPLEYVALPMAIVWGFAVFGDWPDPMSWAGITLILGAGLFMIWRETRAAPTAGPGPVAVRGRGR